MKVVGIDLAGVKTRPTGFCVLDCLKAKAFLLYSDKEIIKNTLETKPAVVAIDAPLSLPKGKKSIEERNNTHFRECDKELLRRKIKFFPITLGPMRSLTKRGIALKGELEDLGLKVIEVYPGGAQNVLKIPRKQNGIDKLRKCLEKLGIKGLRKDMSDHELDAVTCALVGKLFLEGKSEALGNSKEGIMVMPKIKK